MKHSRLHQRLSGLLVSMLLGLESSWLIQFPASAMSPLKLLTDPFLQLPGPDSVRVVWFTEFKGTKHVVFYGQNLERRAIATTTKMSKMREDQRDASGEFIQTKSRDIWRHEARITGLSPQEYPYQVHSYEGKDTKVSSATFSLMAAPPAGKGLKILLTSDHQLKPMTPANLQKVVETVGKVDAVFFAGDLVNIPDRASEWFDDDLAFFKSLQGYAKAPIANSQGDYQGAPIIQSAPIFPSIGNHEVMGRYSTRKPLRAQFADAIPKRIALERYQTVEKLHNPKQDPDQMETWLKNNSFNIDTYQEIFSLPTDSPGGKKYYAITFGDIRLVSLYATNIWRSPAQNTRGKYEEKLEHLRSPDKWGYGQHIFEPIHPGSEQYEWLKDEVMSSAFQSATYRIVMFHHPPHSLGENAVPAFTNPLQIVKRDASGSIKAITYDYPKKLNYLTQNVLPLLEEADTQLVLYGHSHLWNRFISASGMHFLETSNVGNSYGAYTEDNYQKRNVSFISKQERRDEYGNPNGLQPITPNIRPLKDELGRSIPYVASNNITVFSILDTQTGRISSYRFNTRKPNSAVIKFDEFSLKQ